MRYPDAQEFVADLRALADWYEGYPDAPLPYEPHIAVSCTDTIDEVQRVARLAAPCAKSFGDSTVTLTRMFGLLGLDFIFWRSTVCERRVVGTKILPAQPERVVDVVEWVCAPLLTAEQARED